VAAETSGGEDEMGRDEITRGQRLEGRESRLQRREGAVGYKNEMGMELET
jgi:hypothetical protein